MELEPTIRDLLHSFISAEYGACLDTLRGLREDYYLDLYLHSHVDRLFDGIRRRLITQYVAPYSVLDLRKMAGEFQCGYQSMVDELSAMILQGDVKARINLVDGVLVARGVKIRRQLVARVTELSRRFEEVGRMNVLRASILRNELEIR